MFQNHKNELTEFSKTLVGINDLEVLIEIVLSKVKKLTRACGGSIFLRSGDILRCEHILDDHISNSELSTVKYFQNTEVPVDNTSIVGYIAKTGKSALIDDAYKIPKRMPYRFNQEFDKKSSYRTKSIIAMPIVSIRGQILGVLELVNALNKNDHVIKFKKSHLKYASFLSKYVANIIERAQLTNENLEKVVKLAEMRDPKETGNHVKRVGYYSIEIYKNWAHQAGISEDDTNKYKDLLRIAAMLHDVGKVAVSDLILKKRGKLTPAEYEDMKAHTTLGAQLFTDDVSPIDSMALDVVISHHEKWDGSGYPKGLKHEEIPFSGRIVAIADVFEALISNRSYKEPWTVEKAIEYMTKQRGKHFQPELLDSFLNITSIVNAINKRYKA